MQVHSFHIPVMGIGFTIDTPVKVAHLGISSAISLVDDILAERMRQFYSIKFNLPFQAISHNQEDSRAKRITAYLDTVNTIVNKKYTEFKSLIAEKQDDLRAYIALLPTSSQLRTQLEEAIQKKCSDSINKIIDKYLHPGSIDVNIMTKLDKENYKNGEKLPTEFNDAHAALRGFANSSLSSSIVLSAGMNARLYTYMEQFDDFYPNENGHCKKKIILKVSDYRSAIVQGKIFAKKGLWISEFRVESGLNCGGHAFATQGYLMGPILEEFSKNRDHLREELFEIYAKALEAKQKPVPSEAPEMKLTAQGGLGTHEEHQFLMKQYNLDSIGWGSPFLLVPEAVSIDKDTIELLAKGTEEDYFLSHVSPVGVRFNNIRGASRDTEQQLNAANNKPGANCTKQFIKLNKEYTDRPICIASKEYQKIKIDELNNSDKSGADYEKTYKDITVKSCICNGLGVATLRSHGMDTKKEGNGVSICPGPNLAYFHREATLAEMVNHIYGRANLLGNTDRPNLFMKELSMYLDYIEEEMESIESPDARQIKSWNEYLANLQNGMNYYHDIFSFKENWSEAVAEQSISTLTEYNKRHNKIKNTLTKLSSPVESL
ncbi:hypothetical protein [Alkalitalea saponilacus]|uniref:Uncharacterized protein n=1 Tax=Alkalitalea saponilacus TaxID=889453 RepID=A0A1T5HSG7_9BACT|nr:hypothetical protein [Alkalitalea saponilacus]ASB48352.1 hypothetical protein CDL62_03925 [Alkalitalea saponilacus]SKC23577.1 hypothetical protein SAMN03080601_02854 [Alkalitalea saponilacus]